MKNIQARIIKIDPLKESRNKGQAYQRVYFQIKGFDPKPDDVVVKPIYDFAVTDLVPNFRNYKKWKLYLKVGNVFTGIRMKSDKKVDADSNIRFIKNIAIKDEDNFDDHVKQLSLL